MKRLLNDVFVEVLSYSGGDPGGDLRAFRRRAPGARAQAFAAEAVAGRAHLLMCLGQSLGLVKESMLLAERQEVDFLLRVAGTKQISEALKVAGATPGSASLLVIYGPERRVSSAVASIGRLKRMTPARFHGPGKAAVKRTGAAERSAVIGDGDPLSALLVEKAALLRR